MKKRTTTKKLALVYTRIDGVERKVIDPKFFEQHSVDICNSKPYSGKSGIISNYLNK